MPQRIIVLGMFRSGTSLHAKLVQSWGAFAGSESDLFADRYGYLEHLALQKLDDDLMDHNDRLPPVAEVLQQRAKDPEYRERALQTLDQMDRQAEKHGAVAWFWKDPRLPMVLPFWADIWGDVLYVIPVRHPMETIRSAAEMDGVPVNSMAFSAGLLYWQYNMLNILNFTRDTTRKIFIAFDQLISNPEFECQRLCRFLDTECGVSTDEINARARTMTSIVKASNRHHREETSLANVEQATREQRELYNFLRVKTLYPQEEFISDSYALYPGWRDYLQAVTMLMAQDPVQDN